jgi:hypothetical protein
VPIATLVPPVTAGIIKLVFSARLQIVPHARIPQTFAIFVIMVIISLGLHAFPALALLIVQLVVLPPHVRPVVVVTTCLVPAVQRVLQLCQTALLAIRAVVVQVVIQGFITPVVRV